MEQKHEARQCAYYFALEQLDGHHQTLRSQEVMCRNLTSFQHHKDRLSLHDCKNGYHMGRKFDRRRMPTTHAGTIAMRISSCTKHPQEVLMSAITMTLNTHATSVHTRDPSKGASTLPEQMLWTRHTGSGGHPRLAIDREDAVCIG